MANGRFAALAALLTGGSTAAAVPAAAEGADPFAALEVDDATRASLRAELLAFVSEEKGKSFSAANARAVAVMGSDKGKAHPATALAFLGNEKLSALSADEIIASLPDVPKAEAGKTGTEAGAGDAGAVAAAAAAAGGTAAGGTAAGAGSEKHQQRLASAPRLALGNRATTDATVEGTGAAGDDKPKATALWGSVQGKNRLDANGTTVRIGAAS